VPSSLVKIASGEYLFHEGDKYNGVYVIKEGQLSIVREREGIVIPLASLKAGDVVGTLTIFSRAPRTASAKAISDMVLIHLHNEELEQSFRDETPLWAQAVIKDAIARVMDMDEQLIKMRVHEKKLMLKVGNIFHTASKLSCFLGYCLQVSTIKEDALEIFPLLGFLERCESILLESAENLEMIFDTFKKSGLVKPAEDKKYGSVLVGARSGLLQDFGRFSLNVAREGLKGFLPLKLQPYCNGLIRIYKNFTSAQTLTSAQLIAEMQHQMAGKPLDDNLLKELLHWGIVHRVGGRDEWECAAANLQKRIIFESCCRLLEDVQW